MPDPIHPTQSSGKSLRAYLLSGGGWAFGGKVVTSLAGLAVSALLARLLTPEAMGAYFLTFSLVSVAAVFAQLGLSQTAVRLVAESMGIGKPGRARAAVRAVFRYGTIGALIVAGPLTLGAGQWLVLHVFNSSLMASVITLAAVWVVVMTFQGLLTETFRGFHDIRLATIFGGLVTSVLSAVVFAWLWIIQGHSNLKQVIILTVTVGSTSLILAGMLLRDKLKGLKENSGINSRDVMRIAWPLWVTNLSFVAITQADVWILGMFRPQEEVAIYGAAVRLVMLVVTPLLIVNFVVPPLIAKLYAQREKRELENMLRITATLAGFPAFIALVGLFFWGEYVLGLIYGSFYRSGAFVLILLSLGQLFNVLAGSCGVTLMMTGYQKVLMKITIICGVTKIVFALLLVRHYDMAGVAFASTAGLILQNTLMWLAVRVKTGIWTHVSIPKLFNLK